MLGQQDTSSFSPSVILVIVIRKKLPTTRKMGRTTCIITKAFMGHYLAEPLGVWWAGGLTWPHEGQGNDSSSSSSSYGGNYFLYIPHRQYLQFVTMNDWNEWIQMPISCSRYALCVRLYMHTIEYIMHVQYRHNYACSCSSYRYAASTVLTNQTAHMYRDYVCIHVQASSACAKDLSITPWEKVDFKKYYLSPPLACLVVMWPHFDQSCS